MLNEASFLLLLENADEPTEFTNATEQQDCPMIETYLHDFALSVVVRMYEQRNNEM